MLCSYNKISAFNLLLIPKDYIKILVQNWNAIIKTNCRFCWFILFHISMEVRCGKIIIPLFTQFFLVCYIGHTSWTMAGKNQQRNGSWIGSQD